MKNFSFVIYDFFRYDIWRFLGNIWRFRKGLYNHRWYDYRGTLLFMESALLHISENVEKRGIEVEINRCKKVKKMVRVCEIIKHYDEYSYIQLAEKELGKLYEHKTWFESTKENSDSYTMKDDLTDEEREFNSKIYKRANEIEQEEWVELCEILKGQDYSKFRDDIDFDDQFDGSGMKTWWD